MARKRMFDMQIVDTDLFLEMPQSTQNLYFHLGMRADDDGFVSNPKKIVKMVGSNEDDLKVLITKKFIIPFESGVIVIRHWKLNNYLRKDRYIETIYKKEKDSLIEDENGVYDVGIPNGNQMVTNGIPRIEKNRIDKNSIEKENINKRKSVFVAPTLEEIEKYCQERKNNVNAKTFFDYYEAGDWKDAKGNKMKNWKQKVITWEKHQQTDSNSKITGNPFFDLLKEEGKYND